MAVVAVVSGNDIVVQSRWCQFQGEINIHGIDGKYVGNVILEYTSAWHIDCKVDHTRGRVVVESGGAEITTRAVESHW
mgnify:CR=1 FL=1